MTEMVQLLWRRWWCLLGVCVAATARVPLPTAVQGRCEVLDPNIQSTCSLPTNFTVKPTAPGWLLDFTLGEGDAPSTACVRLRETGTKVQVMLFKGDCVHGRMENYSYSSGAAIPPRAWTTLALDIKDNTVLVTAPNSVSIPLKADSWSLPRDALHVTVARGVEAAEGCRVNCPLYRHASEGPDKKKTVKKSCQDDKLFYFRPGEEFVRLEYEVTCTTTEGTKELLPITHIVPPHHPLKAMWFLVELQHLDGEVEVHIDNKRLKKEKLPEGCTFTEHTIRLVGDSHFSFSCNPSTGEVEWVEDDSWYCPTVTTIQPSYMYNNWDVEVLVVVSVVSAGSCLLVAMCLVRKVQRVKNKVERLDCGALTQPPSPSKKPLIGSPRQSSRPGHVIITTTPCSPI